MTLKAEVLDQIAKEHGHKSWKKMIIWQKIYIGESMKDGIVERAVELALATKQAEVLEEINILLADPDFQDDTVLGELKKRLLAKEVKNKNESM